MPLLSSGGAERLVVHALSGEPLMRLAAGVTLEEARQRAALAANRHPPQATHLLDARTGQALRDDASLRAATTVACLLADSYRVACRRCGRGLECSCDGDEDDWGECRCAPSALSDADEALCSACEKKTEKEEKEEEQARWSAGLFFGAGGWRCGSCGERCRSCSCDAPPEAMMEVSGRNEDDDDDDESPPSP